MSLAIDDCRRFPRIAVSLRTRLCAAGETRWGICTNVSRGGVFVRTRWLLPENAIVDLNVGGLPAIGRVARIGTRPAGMGIEFLDVDEEELARIGCSVGDRTIAVRRSIEILCVGKAPFRERAGRIRRATSPRQAVLLYLERRPDLLVCDAAPAEYILTRLRGRVPILCVSNDRATRLRCLRLGADAVADAKSVIDRARRVVVRRPLRGKLSQVPLARVLALLEHERQTGFLLLGGGRFEVAQLPTGSPQFLRTDH
jgi:hypothetical protein